MAVMAGRSASRVGLISSGGMAAKISADRHGSTWFRHARAEPSHDEEGRQTKSPGGEAGASVFIASSALVALAEQLQQQGEQVDEVQVERECAGDRRTFRD